MKFYRYQDKVTVHGGGDEDYGCSPSFSTSEVVLQEFEEIKETQKGHWIRLGCKPFLSSQKWWVSKSSRKRYAYPTKEEAINSLIIRKTRQVKILTKQLKNSQSALQKAKRL